MARAARSLDVLLGQFNTLAPRRNKASDGWIGDTDHQNRNSDHNPWYPPPNGGIVTARDFTHDPTYLNMQWVADTLVAHRDPRIKYIIWSRRIWNPTAGWRAYSGPNPHTNHLHLSVVASPANDSTALWAGFIPQPPEDDMALTDPMGPHFHGGVAPADARNLGDAIANIYSRTKDTLAVSYAIVAEVSKDPDITQERIAEIVRENQNPVDPEQIKQIVREAAAEDNVELADNIVDRIASRLVN